MHSCRNLSPHPSAAAVEHLLNLLRIIGSSRVEGSDLDHELSISLPWHHPHKRELLETYIRKHRRKLQAVANLMSQPLGAIVGFASAAGPASLQPLKPRVHAVSLTNTADHRRGITDPHKYARLCRAAITAFLVDVSRRTTPLP
jgi:hypothetical protein